MLLAVIIKFSHKLLTISIFYTDFNSGFTCLCQCVFLLICNLSAFSVRNGGKYVLRCFPQQKTNLLDFNIKIGTQPSLSWFDQSLVISCLKYYVHSADIGCWERPAHSRKVWKVFYLFLFFSFTLCFFIKHYRYFWCWGFINFCLFVCFGLFHLFCFSFVLFSFQFVFFSVFLLFCCYCCFCVFFCFCF